MKEYNRTAIQYRSLKSRNGDQVGNLGEFAPLPDLEEAYHLSLFQEMQKAGELFERKGYLDKLFSGILRANYQVRQSVNAYAQNYRQFQNR